jgi:hypothetical protein
VNRLHALGVPEQPLGIGVGDGVGLGDGVGVGPVDVNVMGIVMGDPEKVNVPLDGEAVYPVERALE